MSGSLKASTCPLAFQIVGCMKMAESMPTMLSCSSSQTVVDVVLAAEAHVSLWHFEGWWEVELVLAAYRCNSWTTHAGSIIPEQIWYWNSSLLHEPLIFRLWEDGLIWTTHLLKTCGTRVQQASAKNTGIVERYSYLQPIWLLMKSWFAIILFSWCLKRQTNIVLLFRCMIFPVNLWVRILTN